MERGRENDGKHDVSAQMPQREGDLSRKRLQERLIKEEHPHADAGDRIVEERPEYGKENVVSDLIVIPLQREPRDDAEERVRSRRHQGPDPDCSREEIVSENRQQTEEHAGEPPSALRKGHHRRHDRLHIGRMRRESQCENDAEADGILDAVGEKLHGEVKC